MDRIDTLAQGDGKCVEMGGLASHSLVSIRCASSPSWSLKYGIPESRVHVTRGWIGSWLGVCLMPMRDAVLHLGSVSMIHMSVACCKCNYILRYGPSRTKTTELTDGFNVSVIEVIKVVPLRAVEPSPGAPDIPAASSCCRSASGLGSGGGYRLVPACHLSAAAAVLSCSRSRRG